MVGPLVATLASAGRTAVASVIGLVGFLAPMWFTGRSGRAALSEPPLAQLLDASYVALAIVLLVWLVVRPPTVDVERPRAQG